MPVRVNHLDARRHPCRFSRAAQLRKGINHLRAAQTLVTREIPSHAIDENHKDGMEGQVIGQVFESRSQQHDVSFAHLLVEQQWCRVREACCHARLPRFRYCGVENLHLTPTAVIGPGPRLIQRRIAEVHLPYGNRASFARVIMCVLHITAPQRNLRMVAGGTNSRVALPPARTSIFRVAIVLPFTTSDTAFVAAGVPKPAITARTRECFGSFGSESVAGASTLSTVQFAGAGPSATGCNTSSTLFGRTASERFDGIAVRCISLKR